MKVLHVVSSRSGFLQLSPIVRALFRFGAEEQPVLYVGRPEDLTPLDTFLRDLDLGSPEFTLSADGGSPSARIGRLIIGMAAVIAREAPDWIFTGGDGDPELAAAIVGRRSGTAMARLEAGLRTGDRSDPSEITRLVADRLSDLLFTSQPQARARLLGEGVAPHRIHFVGSLVADAVGHLRERAAELELPGSEAPGLRTYLLDLFRECHTVDDPERLESILFALGGASVDADRQALLVMEPALATAVRRHGFEGLVSPLATIGATSYAELITLIEGAEAVVTDAREIRDASMLLGVPSVTIRGASGRGPALVHEANPIVSAQPDEVIDALRQCRRAARLPIRPELWDGKASLRLARIAVAGVPDAVDVDRSASA